MFQSNFHVITKTPLRVSLLGGGTDFEYFYKLHTGHVINTGINKYVYVTVKKHNKLFNENYRLNYSTTESINNLKDIKNDIIRECLKLVPVKPPIYISVISDIPGYSGLGSSSSFTVGLLKALLFIKNKKINQRELAELACKIEINILRNPIGKQDQYVASHGHFASYKFLRNRKVIINDIKNNKIINNIFLNSLLVWTGKFREAKSVLKDQKHRYILNKEYLLKMNTLTSEGLNILKKNFNLKLFLELVHKSWLLKKKLSNRISSDKLNNFYKNCVKNGAISGKLLGAGGGGFFLIFFKKKNKKKIIKFLKNYFYFQCLPSKSGSEIIYHNKSR